MVEQGDAEEVCPLPEPAGEDSIFWTRCGIAGGVVVRTNPGGDVHQYQGLEDFSGMNDGQGQGANGDDIDTDDGMLGIEPADEELFAIQAREERSKDLSGSRRGRQGRGGGHGPVVPDERDPVSRHGIFMTRLRLPIELQNAL